MISIQSSLTDLERSHQIRAAVLDCYVLAIKNIARLHGRTGRGVHRGRTASTWRRLPPMLPTGTSEALSDSRATLRGLLREQRDQGSAYILATCATNWPVPRVRWKRSWTGWGQTDGDHERTLRASLGKLRQVAAAPATRRWAS